MVSRKLVPLAPRQAVPANPRQSKRAANGDLPTTARALVLRNGKFGSRGTGEIVLATGKLTGREKLDLLADDLVHKKSKGTVLAPFRLEHCLKTAESQFTAYLDDIANLRDHEIFFSLIETEYKARKVPNSPDRWRDTAHLASLISTRIHNSYTLASIWHLVLNSFRLLEEDGLSDDILRAQLADHLPFRARYLATYDVVNALVDIARAKFAVLATTAPHYSRYFKNADPSTSTDSPPNTDTSPNITFDWAALRDACKSFLDSIIIELCFPRAPYPQPILFEILHDAIDESPAEAKRFPQALWDAVGDLSVAVELQDMLERPLSGPNKNSDWRDFPRASPEYDKYEKFLEVQALSEQASNKFVNFKDIIRPIERTQKKPVLEAMWNRINLNYKEVSGMDIDSLWQLKDARAPPQWHLPFTTSSSPPTKALVLARNQTNNNLPRRNRGGDDSDGSMPPLTEHSDSSAEYNVFNDSDDDDSDSDNNSDDGDEDDGEESEYDAEHEDDIRDMLREAMDIAHEADFFGSIGLDSGPGLGLGDGMDSRAEERKGNPFLKLLSSLRGRMFSANPKLKATKTTQPKTTAAAQRAEPTTQKPAKPSYKTTVEEIEDEDADQVHPLPKKKKKKKPKKKKTASTVSSQDQAAVPSSSVVDSPPPMSPVLPVPVSPIPTPQTPTSPPKKSSTPAKARRPSASSSATAVDLMTHLELSSASLAYSVEPTAAQSARSYLQAERLDSVKAKVKSRPEATPPAPTPEKKGLFSKLTGGKKSGSEKVKEKEKEKKEKEDHSWMANMKGKTKKYMHQLLRTSEDDTKGIKPLKWNQFVKVMVDMGFSYDPSTAGSSVRFDPPDVRDKPITFHKPHPDSTLNPIMVKDFAKRLKRQYAWCEADFLK